MTTWNIFLALTSALIVRDIVARIIDEISYRTHVKRHGSMLNHCLNWDIEEED